MGIGVFAKYLQTKIKSNPVRKINARTFVKYFLKRNPVLLYKDALIWQASLNEKKKYSYYCQASPNKKESIIICTHEFSVTGVPVLALNLAKFYSEKYNVIVIGYGKDSLLSYFDMPNVSVITANFARHDIASMGDLIDTLNVNYSIKFGIAASIECYSLAPASSAYNIPLICLVNEYAGMYYTKEMFEIALLWSDCSIFSSDFLLSNAMDEVISFNGENSYVQPQGKCEIPKLLSDACLEKPDQDSILNWRKIKDSLGDSKLILGVGFISYRKGVDLFIQCAYELLKMRNKTPLTFIWIGSGWSDKFNASYMIFLRDQVDKLGLTKSFHFIEPIDSLEDVYRSATLVLIPSRIDPLPNIAIDAMYYEIPFVYFDQATGISEVLNQAIGQEREQFQAKYLDAIDMAEKAHKLIDCHKNPLLRIIKNDITNRFNFEKYASKLEAMVPTLQLKIQNSKKDFFEIINDQEFRQDFFSLGSIGADWPNENVARYYIKSWAQKMSRRKPFPGFNPAIYSEFNNLLELDGDPYAHYLRSGRPPGPWSPLLISPLDECDSSHLDTITGKIALHIHAYYPEILPELVDRLMMNMIKPDLYISTNNHENIHLIESLLKNYSGKIKKIIACPNLGRDIGPLITEFGVEIISNYTYFGHLHTKASKRFASNTPGQIWYKFLLENLLGGVGGAMADKVLSVMLQNPDIDLVFPDDPNVMGWDANRRMADMISLKLGLGKLPQNFNFPIGTMFWAKTVILEKLLNLNLTWADYPEEPINDDGTILHAIERIIPFLTDKPVGGYAMINVPSITR